MSFYIAVFPDGFKLMLFVWLLISCYLVRNHAESTDVHIESLFLSSPRDHAKASILTPVYPLHLPPPPHLMRKLASTMARDQYFEQLLTIAQPPATSKLSEPFMMRNVKAPPADGFMSPLLADSAPAHSRLPEPPLSPKTSSCCGPEMVQKRESSNCHCVYPIKLDLLLTNVTQNPNWNLFLYEFASGLGLRGSQIQMNNFYWVTMSSLNISLDITPHTGISFSSTGASALNSSLLLHKVHINSKLAGVGDYKLLNVTWYEPPTSSQAPLSAPAPVKVPHHQVSTPKTPVASKEKTSSLVIILSITAGLVVMTIVFLVIICCCSSHQKAEPSLKDPENLGARPRSSDAAPAGGSLPHPGSTRYLPYEELKKATNNFEKASILGEGGFGKVFKGILSDGTAVAIKRLTNGGPQGDKEFLVEVEMLSRLHHRNLVKLVGYYSSRESAQNLLCYELVPNGSLEAWLHGPLGVNCPLDWDTRMKIALDAARGLAYLHEDSQPCVIHRDFKASNILLENNFTAKVADFGLAKQAPEGRQNYLSTRVMGTFGYVAPEYAMTGHLLVKSDVYSYGVVLLELLTGRKPVDMAQPAGQENLVTWSRPILRDKDRLEELADTKLEGKYPKEDFVRVCTIAAACVAPEANQRPTMGEVVQSLKMVQRVTEYQDAGVGSANLRPNLRQSSTTFESDRTSSIFSSGRYSGLSAFDENISRTAVFSEDLHEGR
ncbi:hypothetical protein RND81_07G009400 [Saponaria officinalis]|uniref:Protein kinase domain-containing protein n=1 Tax=Saponaria officinalis TaxID=3572 RepID=A0AAW1JLU6_SAPOF